VMDALDYGVTRARLSLVGRCGVPSRRRRLTGGGSAVGERANGAPGLSRRVPLAYRGYPLSARNA